MKRVLFVVLLLCLTGCTRPDHAKQILAAQGYTHIEITGYRLWACDDSDTFSTGFKAINSNGYQVAGVVCEGIFKNATIRFD